MKFTVDVELAAYPEANVWDIATAIHDYLCREDVIVDVVSYCGVEPSRHQSTEADRDKMMSDGMTWRGVDGHG